MFLIFENLSTESNKRKSQRAGPHPIGQNGQEEFRSQIPSHRSSIPDPKSQIFNVQKINSVGIFFLKNKSLGQKMFLKKGWVEIFFIEEKKCWSNFFCSEIYLGQKNLFSKKNLGQNFLVLKKNLGQNFLFRKKIWVEIFFSENKFG